MVIAGDFKNGITFELDGNVMQVVEIGRASCRERV